MLIGFGEVKLGWILLLSNALILVLGGTHRLLPVPICLNTNLSSYSSLREAARARGKVLTWSVRLRAGLVSRCALDT